MSEKNCMAHARVKIEVEVNVGSSWGPGCSISQIHKQATEEAINAIKIACDSYRGGSKFRLIGTPSVSTIIMEDK